MTGCVVVLGSVNLDVVTEVAALPRAGETVTAARVRRNVGGKGSNQAVAAHLLGADVTLVARVGDDPDSGWLREGLAATGLDVDAVRTVSGQVAGTAYIAVADAENTIIVDPGANHSWPDGLAADQPTIDAAGVLVLQHEIPTEINELAVAATSARIVLNAAPSRAVPPSLLARCDPLVVNAQELADQVRGGDAGVEHGGRPGLAGDAEPGGRPGLAGDAEAGEVSDPAWVDTTWVRTAMAVLLRRGARSVVTTLGAGGAAWATATGSGQVDAVRVDAVDTTGAGDAFVGALAAELASGSALPDAVRWAVVAASASVRAAGTHASYPDRNAVSALLDRA